MLLPGRLNHQLAELLRDLKQHAPALYIRYHLVIDAACGDLYRPGRRPKKATDAMQYIRAQQAAGRPVNAKLIAEAAAHAGCTTETVRGRLKRTNI